MKWIDAGSDIDKFIYKEMENALFVEFSSKFRFNSAMYKGVPIDVYEDMKIETQTGEKPNGYTLLDNITHPNDLVERIKPNYGSVNDIKLELR